MSPWLLGARPRTLPAAVVPVVVGLAAATGEGEAILWWRFAAALVVSLALQIATNYANDYSDGIKGTDDGRVGPVRLVASGLAPARHVKLAAFGAFGVAGIVGAALAVAVGPELFVVGAAAIAAGWFYTGGSKPYGYYGFGEVFVFVFFGLVATAGTTYVLLERLTGLSFVAGIAVGCLACALLVVNNLRDIPTDTVAGKKTLAVRLGDGLTRTFYVVLIVLPFLITLALGSARPPAMLALAAVVVAVGPVRVVLAEATGRDLIPVLGGTGKLQIVFGALLAIGLALGA